MVRFSVHGVALKVNVGGTTDCITTESFFYGNIDSEKLATFICGKGVCRVKDNSLSIRPRKNMKVIISLINDVTDPRKISS